MQRIVDDPEAWYAALYPTPLRPYQLPFAKAAEELIIDCYAGRSAPETALGVWTRQSGKSTTCARLEVRLLATFEGVGGNIVKSAPTARPQLVTCKKRLKQALKTPLTQGRWKAEEGYIYHLGEASITHLSGEPNAQRVSETADLALVLDEYQDMDKEVVEKDLQPMTMSTGAPTIATGTVWSLDTLLEETREYLRERQKKIGRKLLFEVPWWEVAEHVPRYGEAVQRQIDRLGIDHPIIQTQYCLRALQSAGKFFEARHLELMRGDHPRQHAPSGGKWYVAGIDLAGEDEVDQKERLQMSRDRKRDAIVVTIAELSWTHNREPVLRIVDHLYLPGRDAEGCTNELMAYVFNVWRCIAVVADARGVGEAVAMAMHRARPRQVVALKSSSEDVSRMGFAMLGAAATGRLRMYQDDGSEEHRQFWLQAKELRRELTPGRRIRFFAPRKKAVTNGGTTETVHDDFPKSLGYVVEAAQDHLYSYYEEDFFEASGTRWEDGRQGYG
jgi:hypothetical protein